MDGLMELGFRDCGPAKCHLGHSKALPGQVVELSKLNVPEQFRRKGWANRLLENVCREADRDYLPLVLMVDAPEPHLLKLYNKHGFRLSQIEPACLMIRAPRI